MKTGRFSLILAWAIFLNCILLGTAFAGFGFGGDNAGKSGLDFSGGYDINTVTTVSGKVVTLPQPGEHEHTIIEIKTGKERFNLYVGPVAFWDKKGIPVHINDAISAKGSKAQGQDGKVYLITQKMTNRTTGAQLELRNEKGEPAWSGRYQNTMRHEGSAGGMRHQGSGMMRGGRGMMGH
jgi:hypothetical protein